MGKLVHIHDALVAEYEAGATTRELAEKYGVSKSGVILQLRKAGVAMRPATVRPRAEVDLEEAERRYRAGEAYVPLAKSMGTTEDYLRGRLAARGVPKRKRNDYPHALQAAWRQNRELNEHGDVRERMAKTRERRVSHTGRHEQRAADLLDFLGIPYVRQKAIGKYNVDFALPDRMIALEITTGGVTMERPGPASERRLFIESQGWQFAQVFAPVYWKSLLREIRHPHTEGPADLTH